MSKDKVFVASINPLICMDADDRFHFGSDKQELTAGGVLRYLAHETATLNMEDIKKSYAWIAKEATRLFMVPAEKRILLKIVNPLKHAIGSYMIGNSLEAIALCGIVGEMTAVFLFQISELTTDGKPISNDGEAELQLSKFERFWQSQRTTKLLEFGLIDSQTKEKFDFVSKKRNEYLHNISKDEDNIAVDAKEVFDATLEIVLTITELGIMEGRTVLNQKILNYLEKKGLTENS